MTDTSPSGVVQTQLQAYNAKNIEALLRTYAPQAEHRSIHGELLARGHDELRALFMSRFAEPDLHARLVSRIAVSNFVTDAEIITRNFPQGRGTLDMLCIYEVENGLIQRAWFAQGKQVLQARVG
jgi:putative hydrolase of HD superfamily